MYGINIFKFYVRVKDDFLNTLSFFFLWNLQKNFFHLTFLILSIFNVYNILIYNHRQISINIFIVYKTSQDSLDKYVVLLYMFFHFDLKLYIFMQYNIWFNNVQFCKYFLNIFFNTYRDWKSSILFYILFHVYIVWYIFNTYIVICRYVIFVWSSFLSIPRLFEWTSNLFLRRAHYAVIKLYYHLMIFKFCFVVEMNKYSITVKWLFLIAYYLPLTKPIRGWK